MFFQIVNWRTWLGLLAIGIVTGTIFYSNYLSKKIAHDEKEKVEVWVQSLKTRALTNEQTALDLTNTITSHNTDIPIIETDEHDVPSGSGLNLDSNLMAKDSNYLSKQVALFKRLHAPILVEINKNPLIINKYYYGDSDLLKEVSYYPLIQLVIVAMFVIVMLITISIRNTSAQNQVWAGMAKETAHQLGTPITSLQGWVELLKEQNGNEKISQEMMKDVDRLKLISDRFGKIGSRPQLEKTDLMVRIHEMVAYIKKRATEKVVFKLVPEQLAEVFVYINPPLFDWVLENIFKNALDSIEGTGSIIIQVTQAPHHIYIDITDTGKGISSKHFKKIFKPGFTTKKRGWGLGLTLSKRIIEQYHQGSLFIKSSEINRGATFRIMLKVD